MINVKWWVLILGLLVGCNVTSEKPKEPKKDTEQNLTEADYFGSEKDDPGNKTQTLDELPEIKTYESLTIEEYVLNNYSFETVITRDTVTRYRMPMEYRGPGEIIFQKVRPGILGKFENVLSSEFQRSNQYYGPRSGDNLFIHLKINKISKEQIEITFRNKQSKGLRELIKLVNEELPDKEIIIIKGKDAIDNFIPEESMASWSDYKEIAVNKSNTFKIRDYSINSLSRIDSTRLGKLLYEEQGYKSCYLVSILDPYNGYYPVITYHEQFESDEIYNVMFMYTIDSSMSEIKDITWISARGSDYAMEWDYYSVVNIPSLSVFKTEDYDCSELQESGIDYLKTEEKFLIIESGKIYNIDIDTIKVVNCQ